MGKLFVVGGLGPGGVEQMTKRAYNDALKSCDVIAGYNVESLPD